MNTSFKMAYSLAVAILLVLFVILGTRTFYEEPSGATFYNPTGAQQYQDERVDYHRNVFIVASALGVAAMAAGVYLFRRVEAIPLGLVLGGIGVVIFGWVQTSGDAGEVSTVPLFAVVTVGLGVVLAAGYWFLGPHRTPGADDG